MQGEDDDTFPLGKDYEGGGMVEGGGDELLSLLPCVAMCLEALPLNPLNC